MLGNTPNQPYKFRTKNCAEINDESRGTYSEKNQVRVKNQILRSGLCDYSDAYMLVKRVIIVTNTAAWGQPNNATNKKLTLCAYFNWISKINNTQLDDPHDIDVVMSMYNLIENRDNYSKTFWNFMAIL